MRLEDITSKYYAGSWTVTDSEPLETNATSIVVTEKDFVQEDKTIRTAISMCFTLDNGSQAYQRLSRDSELKVGDKVDPKSVMCLTLSRPGDADIYRVDGKKLAE